MVGVVVDTPPTGGLGLLSFECRKSWSGRGCCRRGKGSKGAVGTSIDRDVPIEEANREIRTTTESTNESTTRKAANAPLEGDKADTIKLLEH